MSYIEFKNISFSYKETGEKIFSKVNLKLYFGEIFGIFAPNGTGKSTLARYILNSSNIHQNNKISYIPQKYNESFFNWLSLENNILLLMKNPIKKLKHNKKALYTLAKDLNIDLDLKLRPSQCSGGMLQQASIIRAFSVQPDFIIADEPFASLDYKIAKKIILAIRKIVKENNICMLTVLHNIEDIKNLCDKVLVIPDKPFSTSHVDGYSQAKVILNECILSSHNNDSTDSFLSLIQTSLSCDNKRLSSEY